MKIHSFVALDNMAFVRYYERQESDFCGARVASKVVYILLYGSVQEPGGCKEMLTT